MAERYVTVKASSSNNGNARAISGGTTVISFTISWTESGFTNNSWEIPSFENSYGVSIPGKNFYSYVSSGLANEDDADVEAGIQQGFVDAGRYASSYGDFIANGYLCATKV